MTKVTSDAWRERKVVRWDGVSVDRWFSQRQKACAAWPGRVGRGAEKTGYRLQANADYMILLASALYGGRKVYAPDRTVDYRVHGSSITGSYAAGHDPSLYIQRYYCFLARNWLCGLPQFGPSLFELLDLEMATVPAMSAGHREMYERAKKLRPGRREEELQAQLESMEHSLSWKLTAPLRAAGRAFGIG